MGSHNLIEERFTLHQMSGSLRIRSLTSLCHMGNCNLIVWGYTAPRNSREAYWEKKIFLFHWLCFFGEPSQFYDTRLYQQYPQRFYFYIFRTLLWPIPNISGLVYLGSMWSEDGVCQTQENDTKRRQGSTSCSCNVLYQYMPSVLGTPIMLLLKYMKGERQTYQ